MIVTLALCWLVGAHAISGASRPVKYEIPANRIIGGPQLKSWYDQNVSMTVVDARSKPYFEGTLLPNARWIPAETSDRNIISALPSKSDLIVVYCSGTECPASNRLSGKLFRLGYNNVFEYQEGLNDWMDRGYPLVQQSAR